MESKAMSFAHSLAPHFSVGRTRLFLAGCLVTPFITYDISSEGANSCVVRNMQGTQPCHLPICLMASERSQTLTK